MYSIEYTRQALKALKTLPRNLQVQILEKIERLAAEPHSHHANAKKLQGRDGYRLRVGDWRVIYTIEHDVFIVRVVDIGPRGGIYQ